MRVVTLRGRVSLWIIVLGGVLFLFEGCSEGQFRSRQSDSAAPSSHSAPSRSAPSASIPSSSGNVTLEDIMAPLQRMDAHLDIFSTELYQVNVRIGRIAR